MSRAWLSLIGIGDDGVLPPPSRIALESADIVYGSARHFELAGPLPGETRCWPSPFSTVFDELRALSGRKVAILATGDPQWYGIGASLARHVPREEMAVFPAPSAFQLAAARMGWALQDCECLSIHGRPTATLRTSLFPGARLLVLTGNGSAPAEVADLLADEGFGKSRMTVLEHLGGAEERIHSGTAENWTATSGDFHTIALEITARPGTRWHARIPGLPDHAFRHDGKMTKQEIRALTLSQLQPCPGALLWDIGSGCGSVAIEWLRAAQRTRAIGLEPHADRRLMAAENALALGVPHLDLKATSAPHGLDGLPDPDAIFIGGGLGEAGIVDACLNRLRPGGRLVANAVTLESEAMLLSNFQSHGGTLTRLSVQRASPVGTMTGWRPAMPVTQWSFTKI